MVRLSINVTQREDLDISNDLYVIYFSTCAKLAEYVIYINSFKLIFRLFLFVEYYGNKIPE